MNSRIGLTQQEVSERRKLYGYNELPQKQQKTVFKIALEVVKEPMFMLLLACATLYMIIGDYTEGAVMLGSVFLIIFITFFQHQRTEKALDALKKLASPRALVIRDGKQIRVAGREVVLGEIVLLNEGDRIPADGEIISAVNFHVDESMLTGESVAVHRSEEEKVFSGSLVVKGKAKIEVKAIGGGTEFGKIGRSLEAIEQEQTKLQKELKGLILKLFLIGALISVLIVVAFYFTRGNLISSFLNGLAGAMAILPEEFPVVMTVFLAMGAWRLSKIHVLTRRPTAIETLGAATVLCSDKTGTITKNQMEVVEVVVLGEHINTEDFSEENNDLMHLIKAGAKACPLDPVDPMERAICKLAKEFTVIEEDCVKEYPFSRSFFAMSLAYTNSDGFIAYTKGAPEAILDLCHVDESMKQEVLASVRVLAGKGRRVLGVAISKESKNLLDDQHDYDFEFLGLLGLEDPIREEVPNAVKECYDAGIKVKMITGDYAETALSIAEQAGIDISGGALSGEEISMLNDDELIQRINNVNVFARIIPEQKLRIVRALQSNDEVVAMTGDGVNDAPALKAADIGVSMGQKGTDVAREASSLVLLDDNFSSIVSAIRSGRKIYDNLQKSMTYIMAIHVPIIGLTLLPAFVPTIPVLLMPLHIIFMELIIDPVCSLAFESEKEEEGIMKRPPRHSSYRFFSAKRIAWSLFMGTLLLLTVLAVYFFSIHEGHTEGQVREIGFTTLIFGNMALILTSLSKTRFVPGVLFERNIALLTILTIASVLLLALIKVPYLVDLFDFEQTNWEHYWITIISVLGLVTILEVFKLTGLRKKE